MKKNIKSWIADAENLEVKHIDPTYLLEKYLNSSWYQDKTFGAEKSYQTNDLSNEGHIFKQSIYSLILLFIKLDKSMEYELIEIFLNIINLEDYSSRENMNMTTGFLKKFKFKNVCIIN